MYSDDQLYDDLENAVGTARYASIVKDNLNRILSFESDFWAEIFYEGKYEEILFWISTPLRRFSIYELSVINNDNDDLFYKGLQSEYFNLDIPSIEDVIKEWNYEIEDNKLDQKTKILLERRIQKLTELL